MSNIFHQISRYLDVLSHIASVQHIRKYQALIYSQTELFFFSTPSTVRCSFGEKIRKASNSWLFLFFRNVLLSFNMLQKRVIFNILENSEPLESFKFNDFEDFRRHQPMIFEFEGPENARFLTRFPKESRNSRFKKLPIQLVPKPDPGFSVPATSISRMEEHFLTLIQKAVVF